MKEEIPAGGRNEVDKQRMLKRNLIKFSCFPFSPKVEGIKDDFMATALGELSSSQIWLMGKSPIAPPWVDWRFFG